MRLEHLGKEMETMLHSPAFETQVTSCGHGMEESVISPSPPLYRCTSLGPREGWH